MSVCVIMFRTMIQEMEYRMDGAVLSPESILVFLYDFISIKKLTILLNIIFSSNLENAGNKLIGR